MVGRATTRPLIQTDEATDGLRIAPSGGHICPHFDWLSIAFFHLAVAFSAEALMLVLEPERYRLGIVRP